ncbi:hypothetical protein B0I35DRAFT_458217 [Stachybotrys elegans]|uniref:Cytochrome c domain-containing protein n=1 Tax=Stachybotrys elegans TaxID=80388 RepID=A0A8K0T2L4_9HYPO|nr:hypothetical protein B0I35DRAFT_458217 [Stachybotrys elegans]
MDHTPLLHTTGAAIFEAFTQLQEIEPSSILVKQHQLVVEEERFRLWAHSLGLQQQGHASLDYRVRDSIIVRDRLAELLGELLEHLQNLLDISSGSRLPYEQDNAISDDSSSAGSSRSSSDDANSVSETGSFHEADFRLRSLSENLDSLYSLATKIRNPKNRPQRTIEQLYKNVPEHERAAYLKEQEKTETHIVAYVMRQYLLDGLKSNESGVSSEASDIALQYASPENWLLVRSGIANARRKQQFIYWKHHAIKLGQNVEPKNSIQRVKAVVKPRDHSVNTKLELQPAAPSLATSATQLPANLLKPDDLKSVISQQSRVSIAVGLKGEALEWPAPPSRSANHSHHFECPYCKILCPNRYLEDASWRSHLIHDLQPYHCTYEDCQDPNRLYGSRQEWINHESQHTRVWHCFEHHEEFETQPEYLEHIGQKHQAAGEKLSEELISSVVGPSNQSRRDCPFCPTSLPDVAEMQKHIIFHLERLALLALPPQYEGGDDDASVRSEDSHEVQMRGRQKSILEDFMQEDDVFQISCDTVQIGDCFLPRKTVKMLVFYSLNRSTVTYYVQTSAAEYKITYPFNNITNLSTSLGLLTISLWQKPTLNFFIRVTGSAKFVQCNDFLRGNGTRNVHILARNDGIVSTQVEALLSSTQRTRRNESRSDSFNLRPLVGELRTGVNGDAMESTLKGLAVEEPYDIERWRNEDDLLELLSDQTEYRNIPDNFREDLLGDKPEPEGFGWDSDQDYRLARELSCLPHDEDFDLDLSRLLLGILPKNKRIQYGKPLIRLDPDCAICHGPASLECDCEARGLEAAVLQAEERMMGEVKATVKDWVKEHAENYIRAQFQQQVKQRYGNEGTSLDSEADTKAKTTQAWEESRQHFPEVLDYYFSLTKMAVPVDDDPAVCDPPLTDIHKFRNNQPPFGISKGSRPRAYSH